MELYSAYCIRNSESGDRKSNRATEKGVEVYSESDRYRGTVDKRRYGTDIVCY